jgi:arabinose-5-phosphate isomerase
LLNQPIMVVPRTGSPLPLQETPVKKKTPGRKRRSSTRPSDLAYGRSVVRAEATALAAVLRRMGNEFLAAVDLLYACKGNVVVTGVGKSGLIGEKVSATLASTGTPSLYLHSAEALHGDVGRVRRDDVVLALSFSGETEEVLRVLPVVKKIGARLVSITGKPDSRLAKWSDVALDLGRVAEACPMGLVPTSSTTATLALGDALAMTVARRRNFSREDYALFHRGGSLGRRLMTVGEVMRRGGDVPTVRPRTTVREAMGAVSGPKGHKAGAALVVDTRGRLQGIFTDGDLRRRLAGGTAFLEGPIGKVMTKRPITVRDDSLLAEAMRVLKDHKIDEVPVVDARGRPVGMLDVQDILEVGVAS